MILFMLMFSFFVMSVALVKVGLTLIEHIPEIFPFGAFVAGKGIAGVIVFGGYIIWNMVILLIKH